MPSISLPSLPPHYSGNSMVYLLGNGVDRWYISGNLAACVIVKGVHGYPIKADIAKFLTKTERKKCMQDCAKRNCSMDLRFVLIK